MRPLYPALSRVRDSLAHFIHHASIELPVNLIFDNPRTPASRARACLTTVFYLPACNSTTSSHLDQLPQKTNKFARLFALNGLNHPFRVHPPQQTFSAQPLQLSNHPLSSPLKNLIQDPGSQSQPPLYYLFSAAEPDYLVVPFAVFLNYVDHWKGLLDAAYA